MTENIEAAVQTVEMTFANAFKLRLDDGSEIAFKAGPNDVPAEFADHWYVLSNVAPPVETVAEPVVQDAAELDALKAELEQWLDEAAKAKAEADQHKASADAAMADADAVKAELDALKAELAKKDEVIANLQKLAGKGK